ncbi:DUF1805 domain-containing protein [Candidatus Bathyarchaeota archaeon]|nr:MAG: DUF1805 domain-containing protein [Candidatus Bathyarchaeota archaeon]
MIHISKFKVEDKTGIGVKIELPNSPPLILLIGERGFVMCGYLNVDAAERLQVAAAMVSGVKSVDDALNAEIKAATSSAEKIGVRVGMLGREAIKVML